MSTTTTSNCGEMMAFFPASNFMLQPPPDTAHDPDHHHHHPHHHHHNPPSLSSLLPLDFHVHGQGGMGIGSMLGKRSMSFPGLELCEEDDQENENNNIINNNGGMLLGDQDQELSDDGSQLMMGGGGGGKKRRLSMEQVKTLEKNFELGNKLEPERKVHLAKALGLQPRQVAIWFQNRRARWKTKQLEKDYDVLKRQFDALKADNDALLSHNHKLQAEIIALKNREPTGSINLNKETDQGSSSSNRSDNSSEIQLDISRTPTTPLENQYDLSTHQATTAATTTTMTTARGLFPPSSTRPNGPQLLFQSPQTPTLVKEETNFTNMFCGIDDQNGFWPWLEQHNFN